MKRSCIKYKEDNVNFDFFERIGFDIYKLNNPEDIDGKIEELVNNNYKTIILSNNISYFSEDIIKKYSRESKINIIIAPKE